MVGGPHFQSYGRDQLGGRTHRWLKVKQREYGMERGWDRSEERSRSRGTGAGEARCGPADFDRAFLGHDQGERRRSDCAASPHVHQ